MIAVDTSTLAHYTNGLNTAQTRRLAVAIEQDEAVLPAVVATEYLSWPGLTGGQVQILELLGRLPIEHDYWMRAGFLRAAILRAGRKAKLGDTLIAQSCLDAGLPLLSSDGDFAVFRDVAGLRLVAD